MNRTVAAMAAVLVAAATVITGVLLTGPSHHDRVTADSTRPSAVPGRPDPALPAGSAAPTAPLSPTGVSSSGPASAASAAATGGPPPAAARGAGGSGAGAKGTTTGGGRTGGGGGAANTATNPLSGPPTVAGAAFVTSAGPSCTQSGARTTNAYDSSGGDGWHSASATMWTGDGCGGTFLWTRLANVSGDADQWQEDLDYYFNTGLSNGGRCMISVYVPDTPYANGIAHYWVTAEGPPNPSYGNRIAAFTIDQAANRGRWITAGTYGFGGKRVTVELDDNGPGANATIVGSDVNISC